MTKKVETVEAFKKRFEEELRLAASNVMPIPIMGDDDSIHLTERQLGYKDGLLEAAYRLKN